jgi:hypothetical protein
MERTFSWCGSSESGKLNTKCVKINRICEICGSHGGKDDDVVLLGCDAVYTRTNVLDKLTVSIFSETLVSPQESTRRHSPEQHRHESYTQDIYAYLVDYMQLLKFR